MRSIKPGRGPSMLGGFVGIFMIIFGIFWTITAISLGAPFIFGLFGIGFVGIAIANTIFNFKHATGKNRYSTYDIVDEHEETDPLNERFGEPRYQDPRYDEPEHFGRREPSGRGGEFCPYCGARVEDDFAYCNKCGKKLPE